MNEFFFLNLFTFKFYFRNFIFFSLENQNVHIATETDRDGYNYFGLFEKFLFEISIFQNFFVSTSHYRTPSHPRRLPRPSVWWSRKSFYYFLYIYCYISHPNHRSDSDYQKCLAQFGWMCKKFGCVLCLSLHRLYTSYCCVAACSNSNSKSLSETEKKAKIYH